MLDYGSVKDASVGSPLMEALFFLNMRTLFWLSVIACVMFFNKLPEYIFWPYGAIVGCVLALISGWQLFLSINKK